MDSYNQFSEPKILTISGEILAHVCTSSQDQGDQNCQDNNPRLGSYEILRGENRMRSYEARIMRSYEARIVPDLIES